MNEDITTGGTENPALPLSATIKQRMDDSFDYEFDKIIGRIDVPRSTPTVIQDEDLEVISNIEETAEKYEGEIGNYSDGILDVYFEFIDNAESFADEVYAFDAVYGTEIVELDDDIDEVSYLVMVTLIGDETPYFDDDDLLLEEDDENQLNEVKRKIKVNSLGKRHIAF